MKGFSKGSTLFCENKKQSRPYVKSYILQSQHWPLPISSKETCDDVIAVLDSDCINSYYMHYILYICRALSKEDIFSKILAITSNLDALLHFENRNLILYYLQTQNIIFIKNRCSAIWGKVKNFNTKLDRALKAQIPECVQLLFEETNKKWPESFYLNEEYFENMQDSVMRAVDLNDIVSIKVILQLQSSNIQNIDLKRCLKLAYYKGHLDIAAIFLGYGINLEPSYVIRPTTILPYHFYDDHINAVASLAMPVHQSIRNIVQINYCKGNDAHGIMINAVTILQLLYSSSKKENDLYFKCYMHHGFHIAQRIIVAASIIPNTYIIVDEKADKHSAFFNLGNLDHPHREPFIYVSSVEFSPHAMHELTHLVLGYIYQNDGRPYYSFEDKQIYTKARIKFLSNVLSMLNYIDPHNHEDLEITLAAHPMLYANSWYLDKDSIYKFIAFLKFLTEKNISTDYEVFFVNTSELESKIKAKITISELITLESIAIDKKASFYKLVSATFDLDVSEIQNLLRDYEQFKLSIKKNIIDFYDSSDVMKSCSYFLERVLDYVKREPSLWDIELLPRILERYTLPDDKCTIDISSLIEYFDNHVLQRTEKTIPEVLEKHICCIDNSFVPVISGSCLEQNMPDGVCS